MVWDRSCRREMSQIESREDGKRRAPVSQRRVPIRGCALPGHCLWDICDKSPARDMSRSTPGKAGKACRGKRGVCHPSNQLTAQHGW